jgi:hypothetical protein
MVEISNFRFNQALEKTYDDYEERRDPRDSASKIFTFNLFFGIIQSPAGGLQIANECYCAPPNRVECCDNMQSAIKQKHESKFELELGSTNYTVIDSQPAKVNTVMAGQKTGTLKATLVRALGNIVTVEVQYDASPFEDMPNPKSFFMSQRELNDYMVKGPRCVLEERK